MADYSDAEVAAALNSCFDLEKFRTLPYYVRERAKKLLMHHRLKPVCFFDQCGFGLRVYMDEMPVIETTDDEAELDSSKVQKQVDLGGHWLRCPGHAWKAEVECLIMNSTGQRYWKTKAAVPAPVAETDEDDEDESEEEDDTTPAPNDPLLGEWVASRHRATIFKGREEAEKVAKHLKGVVIIK